MIHADQDGFVDLHTHSTVSDGSFTPSELIREAVRIGLKAIALTDHDTVSGNDEAAAEAENLNFTFVPGVEIGCDYTNAIFHIVGLWINLHNEKLRLTLDDLVNFRTNRNHYIIEKFHNLGIDIEYEEVQAVAGNEVVGRPHFAQVLFKKGVVSSYQEAFEKYLGRGKKAYMDKKRLTVNEGIELIISAGGIAILAHPSEYCLTNEAKIRSVLSELSNAGLGGIEAYYSTHSTVQTSLYIKIAAEYNLAVSGGSDFHGKIRQGIELGSGLKNNLHIGWNVYQELKARHSELQKIF